MADTNQTPTMKGNTDKDPVSKIPTEVDTASVTSTATPPNAISELSKLFPVPTQIDDESNPITPDSVIYNILIIVCDLPTVFITTLNKFGITSPHLVVNKFGMANHTVAKSLAECASTFLFDKTYSGAILNLFMYARMTILRGSICKGDKKGK